MQLWCLSPPLTRDTASTVTTSYFELQQSDDCLTTAASAAVQSSMAACKLDNAGKQPHLNVQ
jgi:hypothetical protein